MSFEDIIFTRIFCTQKLSVHFNQRLISRPRSVSQLRFLEYQSSVNQFEYILD